MPINGRAVDKEQWESPTFLCRGRQLSTWLTATASNRRRSRVDNFSNYLLGNVWFIYIACSRQVPRRGLNLSSRNCDHFLRRPLSPRLSQEFVVGGWAASEAASALWIDERNAQCAGSFFREFTPPCLVLIVRVHTSASRFANNKLANNKQAFGYHHTSNRSHARHSKLHRSGNSLNLCVLRISCIG